MVRLLYIFSAAFILSTGALATEIPKVAKECPFKVEAWSIAIAKERLKVSDNIRITKQQYYSLDAPCRPGIEMDTIEGIRAEVSKYVKEVFSEIDVKLDILTEVTVSTIGTEDAQVKFRSHQDVENLADTLKSKLNGISTYKSNYGTATVVFLYSIMPNKNSQKEAADAAPLL